MRRALRLLGVAVLAVGALGPTLDALAPCPVQCVDDGPGGDCGCHQSCSCCVHPRLLLPDGTSAPESLSPSALLPAARHELPVPADPRDIFHVPKSLA